jgi:hypothetical protein
VVEQLISNLKLESFNLAASGTSGRKHLKVHFNDHSGSTVVEQLTHVHNIEGLSLAATESFLLNWPHWHKNKEIINLMPPWEHPLF